MPCLMFIKRGIFSFAKRRPLSIFSKKTSVTHRLIRNRYFFDATSKEGVRHRVISRNMNLDLGFLL